MGRVADEMLLNVQEVFLYGTYEESCSSRVQVGLIRTLEKGYEGLA